MLSTRHMYTIFCRQRERERGRGGRKENIRVHENITRDSETPKEVPRYKVPSGKLRSKITLAGWSIERYEEIPIPLLPLWPTEPFFT